MAKSTNWTSEQLKETQLNIEQRKKRAADNLIVPPIKKVEAYKPKGRTPHKEVQEAIYKESKEFNQRINIAPLSVNKAWQGKRFKTPLYIKYEKEVLMRLKSVVLTSAPLDLTIEYGFSNKASDIDNPTKLILDILQKKYNFDDKEIYKLSLIKKIVDKGNQYFEVTIKQLT